MSNRRPSLLEPTALQGPHLGIDRRSQCRDPRALMLAEPAIFPPSGSVKETFVCFTRRPLRRRRRDFPVSLVKKLW